jgi:hypothetical protein
LRLAHRASPGAEHLVARDVAVLQDLQRGEQLAAKEIRPIPDHRQCRERADHVEAAIVRAERGLDPPDRQKDEAVDTILLLDRVQRVRPLR